MCFSSKEQECSSVTEVQREAIQMPINYWRGMNHSRSTWRNIIQQGKKDRYNHTHKHKCISQTCSRVDDTRLQRAYAMCFHLRFKKGKLVYGVRVTDRQWLDGHRAWGQGGNIYLAHFVKIQVAHFFFLSIFSQMPTYWQKWCHDRWNTI